MTEDVNILQGGQVRVFIQKDGSSPANPYFYYGALAFGETTEPLGEREPIYLPSSERRNAWDIVGSSVAPQELASVDFTQRMDRFLRDAWWELRKKKGCLFNMKAVLSNCARPDNQYDFDGMIIFTNTGFTSFTIPGFNPLGGDNTALDLTGSLQIENFNPVRRIKFAEKADVNLLAEAIDGLYHDQVECGDCGGISDGCQRAYVLTAANAGSPGLSSQILHTPDGWETDQTLDIDTLGGLSGDALGVMGLYLVVVSEADGAHHINLLSDVIANTANWSRVNTGYVGGGAPRAMYVVSPTRALIAGAGGYIYKLINPTSGVSPVADGSAGTEPFNAIDGHKQTIVAVGDSNQLLVSSNEGDTFSALTGPIPGVDLTAVSVINDKVWFIGADNGRLYYTDDGGTTWTTQIVSSDIGTINDIWFVDDVVGYMSCQAGASGRVYRTLDNGYSWQNTAPSITALPTAERYRFVAACDYNTLMAGGRVSAAGDGILVVAE